ncbi:hypothetical protein [Acetobacter sp.]|uniref:hypothetical protein n=1 Tax=Acetobacter sp. TaxID=440 RepID=UPI0039E97ABD
MNYVSIAVSAVEVLAQAAPSIIDDIRKILAPIKEGREPTAEEWDAAQAELDAAEQSVING